MTSKTELPSSKTFDRAFRVIELTHGAVCVANHHVGKCTFRSRHLFYGCGGYEFTYIPRYGVEMYHLDRAIEMIQDPQLRFMQTASRQRELRFVWCTTEPMAPMTRTEVMNYAIMITIRLSNLSLREAVIDGSWTDSHNDDLQRFNFI